MRVGPGQEIGYVGNSGDAEGGPAHLHFEEHSRSGRPHDPYKRLRAARIVAVLGRREQARRRRSRRTFLGRMTWIAGGDTGLYVRAAIRLRPSIRIGSRTIRTRKQVVVKMSAAAAAAAEPISARRDGARRGRAGAPITLARQMLRPGVWEAASSPPGERSPAPSATFRRTAGSCSGSRCCSCSRSNAVVRGDARAARGPRRRRAAHAHDIMRAERALGIFVERDMQRAALDGPGYVVEVARWTTRTASA